MKIEVILTEEIFRRFTVFDLFRRRKVWKRPVIWAAILCASAAVSCPAKYSRPSLTDRFSQIITSSPAVARPSSAKVPPVPRQTP